MSGAQFAWNKDQTPPQSTLHRERADPHMDHTSKPRCLWRSEVAAKAGTCMEASIAVVCRLTGKRVVHARSSLPVCAINHKILVDSSLPASFGCLHTASTVLGVLRLFVSRPQCMSHDIDASHLWALHKITGHYSSSASQSSTFTGVFDVVQPSIARCRTPDSCVYELTYMTCALDLTMLI